jgi:sulfite exporter TauE/SafE
MGQRPQHRMIGRDWVVFLLALGLATALNLITAGVLYDAIFSKGPGLSDNATQILTTAFGGIIGVLGSYLGFKAGQSNGVTPPDTSAKPPPSPHPPPD